MDKSTKPLKQQDTNKQDQPMEKTKAETVDRKDTTSRMQPYLSQTGP